MGEFATSVQNYLRDCLAKQYPDRTWSTEYRIAGTPVDVAGTDKEPLVLIELEWRRADPADNSAKLFRHLSRDRIESKYVIVIQIFTSYYDLARGGVSSKRKNAEFVGQTAAESIDDLSYYSVDLNLTPPKKNEEWPNNWREIADEAVEQITQLSIGSEK